MSVIKKILEKRKEQQYADIQANFKHKAALQNAARKELLQMPLDERYALLSIGNEKRLFKLGYIPTLDKGLTYMFYADLAAILVGYLFRLKVVSEIHNLFYVTLPLAIAANFLSRIALKKRNEEALALNEEILTRSDDLLYIAFKQSLRKDGKLHGLLIRLSRKASQEESL